MVEPSEELKLVFEKSINDAKRLKHDYVTVEHLLFALFCSDSLCNIVKHLAVMLNILKVI